MTPTKFPTQPELEDLPADQQALILDHMRRTHDAATAADLKRILDERKAKHDAL